MRPRQVMPRRYEPLCRYGAAGGFRFNEAAASNAAEIWKSDMRKWIARIRLQ